MSTTVELEKQILSLPPAERERIAMAAWESLVGDPNIAADPNIDPEGVSIAAQRDAEIQAGKVKAIGHAQFLRRTRGSSE